MTGPGRYAASDGSFAKSAGSAAARGGILIALAVVIGFVLLWKGFDGGDADAVGTGPDTSDTSTPDDGATDTTAPDDGTTDTTSPDDPTDTTDPTGSTPVAVDDPSTVTVVVLNGTGEGGLASARGDALGAAGYTWTPGNAATVPTEISNVFFAEGFADEAKAVAEALSGGASVLATAPADQGSLAGADDAAATAAADVVVVLGADEALS